MLNPYFYRCPPELGLNLSAPRLKFKITGYSQEDDFTLVGWQFGDSSNAIGGELLYKGTELIAYGGGSLHLPGDSPLDTEAFNPWDRIGAQDVIIGSALSSRLREEYTLL